MSRILLVGCGQLGSRHLQAVASLPQITEIEVVDPRPEALVLGRQRLAEVSLQVPRTVFRWLRSLEEAQTGGDLCIVATQAEGRCEQIKAVAEKRGYSRFLVEKIVGQSVEEMEDLIQFCGLRGLSVWVNLKTRALPIHLQVKAKLIHGEPILFTVVGGNLGLANNGVHMADLFAFYDETDEMECTGAVIDPALHPSKRGRNIFDLSGALQARTDNGSRFSLTYAKEGEVLELVSLVTSERRFLIDHFSRWAVESERSNGWAWQPIPFEGEPRVSHMTKGFVLDILMKGRCLLPTLEEAMIGHRFILDALRPHFSRLLEKELKLCPVT